MSEPRGAGIPGETASDFHDLEVLVESGGEVSRHSALDHYSDVCEWTVSDFCN